MIIYPKKAGSQRRGRPARAVVTKPTVLAEEIVLEVHGLKWNGTRRPESRLYLQPETEEELALLEAWLYSCRRRFLKEKGPKP